MTNSSTSTSKSSKPRVILLADSSRSHIISEAKRLIPLIEQHFEIVHRDFEFATDLSKIEADFTLVLGGDGSILRAARQMAYRQLPVIGVNLGRLGFLADLHPTFLEQAFPKICSGDFCSVEHLMFECTVTRDGESRSKILGLNEVAVLAGAPFAILEVELYVDGDLATIYSCDGLIVSTPVGSTAHSLSAGGPILQKNMQAFVISPISPHTLTIRPVVDTADRIYELAVPRPHAGTSLVIDGQVVDVIKKNDRIKIEKAKPIFQLVEIQGHGFYQTIREKLGWDGQLKLN